MIFWSIAGLMTVAVLGVLARSLLRRPEDSAARMSDLDVYRDQMRELDHDLDRGVLSTGEAEAAKAETARRLLSADASATRKIPPARRPLSARLAAIGIAVMLPLGAAGLYFAVGADGAPDQPMAERRATAEAAQAKASAEFSNRITALAERLRGNPQDIEGWVSMAQMLRGAGQSKEALRAYEFALKLSDNRPDIASGYGEMLVAAADGQVTPAARAQFDQVLAATPDDARAHFYLGLADIQSGDSQAGFDRWAALWRASPADAPWMPSLGQQLGALGGKLGIDTDDLIAEKATPAPGPNRADIEAAASMTPQEQRALIESMVTRLAARLEEEPDDLEGWLRLGRAYQVLSEPKKAEDAFRRALAIAPDNAAARAGLEAGGKTGD